MIKKFNNNETFLSYLKEKQIQVIKLEKTPAQMQTTLSGSKIFPADELRFWHGVRTADGVRLLRETFKGDSESNSLREIEFETRFTEALKDNGTHMFVSITSIDDSETLVFPLSPECQLSLTNRTRMSIHPGLADIGCQNIRISSLARTFEDMLHLNSPKGVQLIIFEGQIIGIMSNRYASISQAKLFTDVVSTLEEIYGTADLVNAIDTVSILTARFDIEQKYPLQGGKEVNLFVDVHDSPNGHREVGFVPVYSLDKVHFYLFPDDGWSSSHIGINHESIKEGLSEILLKIKDNTQNLEALANTTLKYPAFFLIKATEKLNEWAKTKSGVKIPAKTVKAVQDLLEWQIEAGICTQFTPMDIFDILLEEVNNNPNSSTDGIIKTISRMVRLKIDELDQI